LQAIHRHDDVFFSSTYRAPATGIKEDQRQWALVFGFWAFWAKPPTSLRTLEKTGFRQFGGKIGV
jgi:hypothetical protein